jgi:hypothetical protein
MKTKLSILSWFVISFTLLGNTLGIKTLAETAAAPAENRPFSCANPDGVCIKELSQAESMAIVTIHNDADKTGKTPFYFNLRYTGKGYSSGIIKLKSIKEPYWSKDLKFDRPYKFEVRRCQVLAGNKIKCTKWYAKNIKLGG